MLLRVINLNFNGFYLGNLDPEVDEKLLYDTFSAFGVILTTPKIQRDPETGNSKGFAFINYASFEASDAAIEAMNGKYCWRILWKLCMLKLSYYSQGNICATEPSPSRTPSRRTPRGRGTALQLRDCWLPRTRCPRLTGPTSCLLTPPRLRCPRRPQCLPHLTWFLLLPT